MQNAISPSLTISLVQSDIVWMNPMANLSQLEEQLWEMDQQVDLIILPEMYNTGFSKEAVKHAEPMNLTTFKWMKQMAAQFQAAVTGSFAIRENSKVYNRLIWMNPDGSYHSYDKKHLFQMAKEDESFSSGNERIVVELNGWRVCPLICYDLRFPVWSRNYHLEYDLLLYVANWPKARIDAWDALLKARAIENMCYSIGVNRTGIDGAGIPYNGQSCIYSPKGEELLKLDEKPSISLYEVMWEPLDNLRNKFPVHRDQDPFTIG